MARQIPPEVVGEVDRNLATARSNLRTHVADFAKYLAEGDSPETVFAGFAQTMRRDAPSHHLAVMLSAAVLTIQERVAAGREEHDALRDFTMGYDRDAGFVLGCNECRHTQYISPALLPSPAHFVMLALDHRRRCP